MQREVEDARYSLLRMAKQFNVYFLAWELLDNPKFLECSGSSKPEIHHYGTGGLIVHTHEVVQISQQVNTCLGSPANATQLFLAALYHDAGKMFDYRQVKRIINRGGEFEMIWEAAPHKDLIGHLSRSALIWNAAAFKFDYDSQDSDEILHGILAHHGERAWGSPVTPKTPLAWLLHCADNMSAKVNESRK